MNVRVHTFLKGKQKFQEVRNLISDKYIYIYVYYQYQRILFVKVGVCVCASYLDMIFKQNFFVYVLVLSLPQKAVLIPEARKGC